ncbi:GGDEF domain-containing protein [Telmatospirillum sp.]|uniref:GGDEF domain-containing protein n=1 Tax=Telmatospirillum sp. TaxID=2079197 RepID=UPI0028477D6C|nr:GGDEF domain-containing protein [Telmatospirillum sp.]MDR3435532.1 GGDEF domain-containing protein [Telmatospirillum sp.]
MADGESVLRMVANRTSPCDEDTASDTHLFSEGDEETKPDDSRAWPCLIAMTGPDSGRTYILDQREILIGRADECDIPIMDPTVSRQHARLYVISGDVELFDLESSNGVTVNAERVQRCHLQPEDVIRFGRGSTFRFAYVTKAEKEYLQKLFDSAVRDQLTNLFNRTYFTSILERSLSVGRSRPTVLLMLDLDRFKLVNDSFGHPVGDQVLQHVAKLLAAESRGQDVAARYGGEEFMMLLHNVTLEGGVRVAERIRATVEGSPLLSSGETILTTVSIGIASAHEVAADSRKLIALADKRLYAAKNRGRNQTCAVAVNERY